RFRSPVPVAGEADGNRRRLAMDGYGAHFDPPACIASGTLRSGPAGTPATIVYDGTSRVTTAPAPTMAPSPIVMPARIVALVPIEAPSPTRVSTTFQSASVCNAPPAVVARGYKSFVNMTPWPTKTPSPIVTPSQMNVWLEILQLRPINAPRWISTNAPIFEPSPIAQPYRLTSCGCGTNTS